MISDNELSVNGSNNDLTIFEPEEGVKPTVGDQYAGLSPYSALIPEKKLPA